MSGDPRSKDVIRGLGLTAYSIRDIIELLKAQPRDKDGYRQRSRDFLRLRLQRVLLDAKAQHR